MGILDLTLRPPLKVTLERAVNQRKSLFGTERLAVESGAMLVILWSLRDGRGRAEPWVQGSRSAAKPFTEPWAVHGRLGLVGQQARSNGDSF